MIVAGDIVCVRGQGWLSEGILAAEYGKDIPATGVSHVGLLIEGDPIPVVIEALNRVKTNPLSVTIENAAHAFILHDKSLTDAQRQAIVAKALTFSADDYGYVDLVSQWLDAQFKTMWWTDKLSWYLSHFPICSYVVAAAYAAVGLDFGVPIASAKPSDVMAFAMNHHDIYDIAQIK